MSEWNLSQNGSAKTFRPPSDNSSYFQKNIDQAVEKARAEINEQVRHEANTAIHNIVTAKDAEIAELKEQLETGGSSIDIESINNMLLQAIKYGKKTDDSINNEQLVKLRDVILTWKEFFEEYKWKSNYISNKIKDLLTETNDSL
jgi:anti-sigma28 factor (negative regulator of flagellin synthesis)